MSDLRIRAAVFDLDGTLTDTLKDISEAMNFALRSFGLPEWETDDYRYLVGDGVIKLAERAVRDRQELAPQVKMVYQARYETHNEIYSRPYPGIPELLGRLNAQGIPVCVLSNKPHVDTLHVVKHYFPEITFAQILGQTDRFPVKPDPAGALWIAEQLGLNPEDFAYFGDTATDMICARRAGMHPVGVLWGFRSAEELTESGAEILISHPDEFRV